MLSSSEDIKVRDCKLLINSA